MQYPSVTFDCAFFAEDPPDLDLECPEDWFAGQNLASWLAVNLPRFGRIEVDPDTGVVAEDWGWCLLVRVNGQRFFLGVGEVLDMEGQWLVFVAKDFDFFARWFGKNKLCANVRDLRRGIAAALVSRDDIFGIRWHDGTSAGL